MLKNVGKASGYRTLQTSPNCRMTYILYDNERQEQLKSRLKFSQNIKSARNKNPTFASILSNSRFS